MEILYIWRKHTGLLCVDSVSTSVTGTGGGAVTYAPQMWCSD